MKAKSAAAGYDIAQFELSGEEDYIGFCENIKKENEDREED